MLNEIDPNKLFNLDNYLLQRLRTPLVSLKTLKICLFLGDVV